MMATFLIEQIIYFFASCKQLFVCGGFLASWLDSFQLKGWLMHFLCLTDFLWRV